MTMRLDIVTNDAGELVRREHARELGAGVVVAIYRLAKLAQMHDLGNQAFLRQLDQTHQLIGDYCLRSGENVNVLFAEKAVFVAGQLLKGNRGAYEGAAELGVLLEKLGGSELTILREVTREELHAFAEQVSLSHRTGHSQIRLPARIKLRRVGDAARLRGIELETLTPDQRILRTYASAVVIMRRFFEDLSQSRYVLPRRIKRVAQGLVDLAGAQATTFLGVTEARNANHDEAGRAVNTAILAVAIAREATVDRTTLAQIAMAAMMHDVARPRALALAGSGGEAALGIAGPTVLSEDQEDRLAAGAAAVLTALGRVNEPTVTRTVLTFESLWLRRRTWIGPVYWGSRTPTLHATIIAVARRYNDLLTPEPGLAPPTTDYAIAVLSQELTETQDRTVLRMLVSALGLLPTGTVVLLSSGQSAEVVRGSHGLGDRPLVKLLPDGREIDLAQDERLTVQRVLGIDGWQKGLATKESPAELEEVGDGPQVDEVEVSAGRLRESMRPERTVFQPKGPEAEAPPVAAGLATAQEPTARGNLSATPLPHVLVYMLDHALTGSVVFEGTATPGGADDTIFFVSGVPAKVRIGARVERLGEILVAEGALDAAAVEPAVAGARQMGVLFGEYLVGHDLVTREALARALGSQLLRKTANLANLAPEIEYAFYGDLDLLDGASGAIALGHPLDAILASLRRWADRSRVAATLARIGPHPLVLHPDSDLAGLGTLPEEQRVLDVIRSKQTTLSEVLELAEEDVVASLVYALAVTRQFAFTGQKKGPMAVRAREASGLPHPKASTVQPSQQPRRPVASEPVAAAASAPESSAAQAPARTGTQPRVAARAAVAGPPSTASPRAIAPAARPSIQMRQVVVKRATGPQMPPGMIPKPVPRVVRAAPTPPRSEGTKPVRSDFADSAERAKPSEPELDGATCFRRAEEALAANDLAGAATYAKRAVDAAFEPDHVVLHAWVRVLNGSQPAEDALRTLSKVLIEEPSNERALFYRAKVLVRTNRLREALHDLTELLAANPNHAAAKEDAAKLAAQLPASSDGN